MNTYTIIPQKEFDDLRIAEIDQILAQKIYSDMCRLNTLVSVKVAGSGHLGSSFSAMDIVTHLYLKVLNVRSVGYDDSSRDIYFSSKGHDVPGLYSLLYSLGTIPKERFIRLRRMGGMDGHPDVKIPGIESNSGSLGMGISKGRGMAWAQRFIGVKSRVFVMTGDGELQEGQNYEALQAAIHQGIGNLTVIVDHNKVQSDKLVNEIMNLHDLVDKFRTFGWHVERCDGHDFCALTRIFKEFELLTDRPKVLIADTIKGRGVSFMEHPLDIQKSGGLYRWHSGAPSDQDFCAAFDELLSCINKQRAVLKLNDVILEELPEEDQISKNIIIQAEQESLGAASKKKSSVSSEYVSKAYGKALVELAKKNKKIIVLDADLAADCKIREFEKAYPDRFIENGIAEQDMVSMAGGLARWGLLPVVNSFASFLASRANEQIYNNATENTKIIYALHYAGLIPAGPGKSHQSIRDVSLLGALPNMEIIQPCNAVETEKVMDYCVNTAQVNCAVRLIIGPSPRAIVLPADYQLEVGKGVVLAQGDDAVMLAYGPVMLHEALLAAEVLATKSIGLRVVNMPWLNRVDLSWLRGILDGAQTVFVVEDHAPVGGLADRILFTMAQGGLPLPKSFECAAVEGYPVCGNPQEALRAHRLDGSSLAARVEKRIRA